MVALFTKKLLSWYVLTIKFRETVEAGVVKSPASTPSRDLPVEVPQQESQLQTQSQKQEPSPPHFIPINGDGENVKEEGNQKKSEAVISIKEKLEQARQDHVAASWSKLCIYRVPRSLREGHESQKAFVPQIVSLGPYHHGREHLRDMERHKWRSFRQILRRTRQEANLYLNSIRELEEKARACYEGPISLSSYQFVEMMVLDGCFVLEIFRGATKDFTHLEYSHNDPVFAMRGVMHSIQRDMIMLENQIPLFVLDRLLGLQVGKPYQRGQAANLALLFFDPLIPTDEPLRNCENNILESSNYCLDVFRGSKLESSNSNSTNAASVDPLADQSTLHCLDVFQGSKLESSNSNSTNAAPFDPLADQSTLHCLDVFRGSLLRKEPPEPLKAAWIWRRKSRPVRVADTRRQQLIHCVTELRELGVDFRRRKTDRFWDIKFENGVLWIPRLLIHDGTKSLFLNLIAYEQCHLGCGNEITSYVILMDNLINSPEDVAYLHYHEIIEHWLGSNAEVAELFNKLCQEVVYDKNQSELSQLSKQVNTYCNHKWNSWRATLAHNYFNNPWAIISVFAAVYLLILTSLQTFYSVYAYYRP